MSFGLDNPNFMEWWANITSRGRALLMLFLFSDVGESDAPTRIRVGSHIEHFPFIIGVRSCPEGLHRRFD